MSEPTREHVEAVGNLVGHMDCFACPEGCCCDCGATSTAEAILTSTDPLVLDAMEAALVNAGWLTVDGFDWGVQRAEPYEGIMRDDGMTQGSARATSEALTERWGKPWPAVSRRRLVSEWRAEP